MKKLPFSILLMGLLVPLDAHAQAPDRSGSGQEGKGPGKKDAHRLLIEAWKKADQDRDGFLSRAEFDAMPRIQNLPDDKRQQVFERLDKNKDGKLAPVELRQHDHKNDGHSQPLRRLAELDADKSGGVSLEEFKAGPFFQKLPAERQMTIFQRLDTDGDGELTPKDRPQPPWKPENRKRPEAGDGMPPGGSKPDSKRFQPERILRTLDKDGDGAVTFEEFRSGPAAESLSEDEQEDRFEAMDRNKDQKLSKEDFVAGQEKP